MKALKIRTLPRSIGKLLPWTSQTHNGCLCCPSWPCGTAWTARRSFASRSLQTSRGAQAPKGREVQLGRKAQILCIFDQADPNCQKEPDRYSGTRTTAQPNRACPNPVLQSSLHTSTTNADARNPRRPRLKSILLNRTTHSAHSNNSHGSGSMPGHPLAWPPGGQICRLVLQGRPYGSCSVFVAVLFHKAAVHKARDAPEFAHHYSGLMQSLPHANVYAK